jgi:hypothetical protein
VVLVPVVIVVVGATVLAPSAPDLRAQLVSPSGPVPTSATGFALVGTGVLPETQSELDRLIALLRVDPDDTNAYMELGYVYLQRARETGDPSGYVRGDTAFDEALRRDPAGVGSLTGRAMIALARHDFSGALELADRALRHTPRFGPALGARADALTELGRYDEAADAVQTMVDLRPDVTSYSRVSYQRELRGNVEDARDAMIAASICSGRCGDRGPDLSGLARDLPGVHLGTQRTGQGRGGARRPRRRDRVHGAGRDPGAPAGVPDHPRGAAHRGWAGRDGGLSDPRPCQGVGLPCTNDPGRGDSPLVIMDGVGA